MEGGWGSKRHRDVHQDDSEAASSPLSRFPFLPSCVIRCSGCHHPGDMKLVTENPGILAPAAKREAYLLFYLAFSVEILYIRQMEGVSLLIPLLPSKVWILDSHSWE